MEHIVGRKLCMKFYLILTNDDLYYFGIKMDQSTIVTIKVVSSYLGTFYFLQSISSVHYISSGDWLILVTIAFQLQKFVTNSMTVPQIWNDLG